MYFFFIADNKNLESKLRNHEAFNKTQQIEQSWIYNFCIRCRGEDHTPGYEPSYWQKICPFPLCPTYRQFSRFWSIIIIGKVKGKTTKRLHPHKI